MPVIGGRACPGTQLIFSSPQAVQRNRIELEINDFKLADYRVSSDSQ